MTKQIYIYTDGGARGNPGPAGIGVVVYDEHQETIGEVSEYIGEATNNIAEYKALVRALEYVTTLVNDAHACALHIKLDSQLVEKQMTGQYKVKDATLQLLYKRAKALIDEYGQVTFEHIPRSKNAVADALANRAMDNGKA